MTTEADNIDVKDNKWCCPQCGKYYSKNYPYKSHLKRCLIHNEKINAHSEFLGEMLSELKDDLKDEFKRNFVDMINDLKNELKKDNYSKLFQIA